MTKDQLQKYYEKFPSVLKEKLKNGILSFPKNTEFDYEPIEAYRGVVRKDGDNTSVNLNDMLSYYKLGVKPKATIDIDYDSDPKYYAVSLFRTVNMLKESLKFPRPNKKVAKGFVYKEGGPQHSTNNEHISWWLFDGVDLSGFDIMENENG